MSAASTVSHDECDTSNRDPPTTTYHSYQQPLRIFKGILAKLTNTRLCFEFLQNVNLQDHTHQHTQYPPSRALQALRQNEALLVAEQSKLHSRPRNNPPLTNASPFFGLTTNYDYCQWCVDLPQDNFRRDPHWNILYCGDNSSRSKQNCDILKRHEQFVYLVSTQASFVKILAIGGLPLDIIIVDVDAESFHGWDFLRQAQRILATNGALATTQISWKFGELLNVGIEEEITTQDSLYIPTITVALYNSGVTKYWFRSSDPLHRNCADINLNADCFTFELLVNAILGIEN